MYAGLFNSTYHPGFIEAMVLRYPLSIAEALLAHFFGDWLQVRRSSCLLDL